MSEHFFGITTVKPTAATARLWDLTARRFDGAYVEVNRREGEQPGINGGHYQGWFAIPNLGHPFDERTAKEISAAIQQPQP